MNKYAILVKENGLYLIQDMPVRLDGKSFIDAGKLYADQLEAAKSSAVRIDDNNQAEIFHLIKMNWKQNGPSYKDLENGKIYWIETEGPEKTILAINLKWFRKKKFRMTQQELADKLTVTRSNIGSYEEGRSTPTLRTIMMICELFNVSIDDFVTREITDNKFSSFAKPEISKPKVVEPVTEQESAWVKSEVEKPEHNVSVLVFIPEEDNHITTGMWDVSNKWVLLDEYRVPNAQVTYWRPMVDRPKDESYTQVGVDESNSKTSDIIRNLQKANYDLLSEVSELRRQLETGHTAKRTLFEGSINPMIPPQEVEHIKDPAKYIVYLLKKVEELERQLEFYQDKNQNQ